MRIGLSILFLILLHDTYARVGMGETIFNTPNGHQICDCDPYTDTPVLVGHEKTIHSLVSWYFYRDHIIGQGKNYYFIFDEITNNLQYFNNKKDWEDAVKLNQLEPFYTRWCAISDSPDSFLFAIVLSAPITIPLFLIVLLAVVVLTYVKTIVWTKKNLGRFSCNIFGIKLFAVVSIEHSQFLSGGCNRNLTVL